MKLNALTSMVAAVAVMTAGLPAAAMEAVTVGKIKIEHIWSRATPKGARVAAGYMRITNTGDTADVLVAGTHPTAGRVEIHTMAMSNGVMRMRKLENGLEIPPGAAIELKPGGYHVMFLQIGKGHVEGETVAGSLTFKQAGTVDVTYQVRGMAAGMKHGGHGKTMDHGSHKTH
jgi:copper(I)-binding protein